MLIYWLQHQRFLFKVFYFYFTTIPGDFICSSLWNICFFLRKLTESQVHLPSNRISTILIKGTIHPWENHCCFLTLKGIKGNMYCNLLLWLPTNKMFSNYAMHFSLHSYLNILAGDLIPLNVTFFFHSKALYIPWRKTK